MIYIEKAKADCFVGNTENTHGSRRLLSFCSRIEVKFSERL